MRTLFLVLVVAAGAALASAPAISGEISGSYGYPSSDDNIDSYAYDAGDALDTAFASFGDYVTADDMTLSTDAEVQELTYWTLTTAASMPTSCSTLLYQDTGSGPGTEMEDVTSTVVNTATGISFGSYTVYESDCTPGTPISADVGTTYWITVQRQSADTWYFLAGTTVRGQECYLYNSGWVTWSSQGYAPSDMFRILYGSLTPLDRGTWGSIKTLF